MKKPYIGKIVQCVNDGKLFRSTSEAARYYQIAQSGIHAVCIGKQLKTCGLQFKFIEPTRDIIKELRAENEI